MTEDNNGPGSPATLTKTARPPALGPTRPPRPTPTRPLCAPASRQPVPGCSTWSEATPLSRTTRYGAVHRMYVELRPGAHVALDASAVGSYLRGGRAGSKDRATHAAPTGKKRNRNADRGKDGKFVPVPKRAPEQEAAFQAKRRRQKRE